jgi:hypothetical protein
MAAPSDFGQLAKRITTWTTNCLLTAIVVVAGVGFGRQVLIWWSADPAANDADRDRVIKVDAGSADAGGLYNLQFGDQSWSFGRQAIQGDQAAAAKSLRSMCRLSGQNAQSPALPPQKEELELLESLSKREPLDREAGKWAIFQLNEAFPLMVVLRDATDNEGRKSGTNLAKGGPRVVTWGLAMPAGPDMWAVYTFHAEPSSRQPFGGLPDVPIPPGCQRTLAMQAAGGEAMIGFEGPYEPENCIRSFEQWFDRNGWKAVARWNRSGSSWSARYVSNGPDNAEITADVQFAADQRQRLAGLLIVYPNTESKKP